MGTEQRWGREGREARQGLASGKEKPAAPSTASMGVGLSDLLSYLNPKSACGYADGVSRHLWSPHCRLFPKARGVPNSRHREHPIVLSPPVSPAPQNPGISESRRQERPASLWCPMHTQEGGSHKLLCSPSPKAPFYLLPKSPLLEFKPFLLTGLIPFLGSKSSQRWGTFKAHRSEPEYKKVSYNFLPRHLVGYSVLPAK